MIPPHHYRDLYST